MDKIYVTSQLQVSPATLCKVYILSALKVSNLIVLIYSTCSDHYRTLLIGANNNTESEQDQPPPVHCGEKLAFVQSSDEGTAFPKGSESNFL